MALHAKSFAVLGVISVPRLVVALVAAYVLGGTAITHTPVLAGEGRTPAACEVIEHDGMLELGAVMQIITHCQDDLGLSEAQRERLDTLGAAFIEDVTRREAGGDVAEHALAALLRLDPEDPGRPVDIAAAEAKIRELERIAADQDLAALRVVEASKAVLTAAQRAKLAALLAASRGLAAPKLDL